MDSKRTFNLIGQGLLILFLGAILFKNSQQPQYLNEWDERFHALVAKNLLVDPSLPRLYKDSAVKYNYDPWYRTVIWLHKPPLFSYQAALVMKVFGDDLWGYRLNGLFTLALLIFTFYKVLRLNKLEPWPALLTASGTLFSLAFLKLSNGVLGMGQNDLSFILWISAGVYFAEKARLVGQKERLKNILFLALFSALAVLTKFLVGYLPFLILGLNAIIYRWHFKYWLAIALGALVPALAIGSWYAYTYQLAPELTLSELAYNARHFSESLESHSQDLFFHLEWFSISFVVPIILGLLLLTLSLWKGTKAKSASFMPKAFWAPLLATLFVLTFFTIAKTKLPAFSLVSAPLLMVMVGVLYRHLALSIGLKAIMWAVPAIGILWGSVYVLRADYTNPKKECQQAFYSHLGETLPPNAVLFNVESFNYPEAMFYSGLICYENLPYQNWLEEASAKGYLPYLLLRGGESAEIRTLFQGRLLEYPCSLE